MRGNYKIGIVALLLLAATAASAITEIGDNIIATWVNASFFKGDGALITNINATNIASGQLAEPRLPNGTVVLINANETDAEELSNSNAEATLMTYDLAPNNYSRIILEAEVRIREDQDVTLAAGVRYFVNFTQDGSQLDSFAWLFFGTNSGTAINPTAGTTSGTIKTSFAGGQTSTTTLALTGKMNTANAANAILAKSFRVYGVI